MLRRPYLLKMDAGRDDGQSVLPLALERARAAGDAVD